MREIVFAGQTFVNFERRRFIITKKKTLHNVIQQPTQAVDEETNNFIAEEDAFLDNELESLSSDAAEFVSEVVYDIDSFGENIKQKNSQRHLTPPPPFNEAIKQIPAPLQKKFEELLNGKIIGIWPIKPNILKK